jgi:hypothetical protein
MFPEVFLVQIWKNFGKRIPKYFFKTKKFEKRVPKFLFKGKKESWGG